MKIINTPDEDLHMHSLNFSDGWHTIDEIVKYAGQIGLKKIAITDHSDVAIELQHQGSKSTRGRAEPSHPSGWKNILNDVEVIFGIECDIIDEQGNISDTIQNCPSEFLILSLHDVIYKGTPASCTNAIIKAIEKHHKRIKFIAHPFIKFFGKYLDMARLIEAANKYDIPLEINNAYIMKGYYEEETLRMIVNKAKFLVVNSDAHTLSELTSKRKESYDLIEELKDK